MHVNTNSCSYFGPQLYLSCVWFPVTSNGPVCAWWAAQSQHNVGICLLRATLRVNKRSLLGVQSQPLFPELSCAICAELGVAPEHFHLCFTSVYILCRKTHQVTKLEATTFSFNTFLGLHLTPLTFLNTDVGVTFRRSETASFQVLHLLDVNWQNFAIVQK